MFEYVSVEKADLEEKPKGSICVMKTLAMGIDMVWVIGKKCHCTHLAIVELHQDGRKRKARGLSNCKRK